MRISVPLTATLLLTSMAWAQEQEPPPVAVPAKPTQAGVEKLPSPENLAKLVGEIRWPARNRGPLLLVAPDRLRIPADVLAGARSREGLAITTLAPLINHKIEHYDNLSVLAPLNMPTLGMDPNYLKMIRIGRSSGKSTALLGALTEAQWSVLLSENGLGRENLATDRQRNLWDSMLPPQLLFQIDAPKAGSGKPQLLSQAQISGLRLRISRRISIKVGHMSWFTNEPAEGDGRLGYINAILDPELMEEGRDTRIFREPTMANEVPYKRKKTDLDPARLETPISLEGVKTVGELVARVAKASNIELYADLRLAGLPVTVITEPGQGVKAGNALAAVIRATTGAIRAINAGNERAFVLTHDRVPLAVTSTEISDAIFPIFVEMAGSRSGSGARLPDVWSNIPKREYTASPDSIWQKGEELDSKPVLMKDLPPAIQERARKFLEMQSGENTPFPDIKRDSVTVQAQAAVELVAPFWQGATAQVATLPVKAFRRSPDLPLAALPSAPKTCALKVALPRTPAERARLLAAAAERGFTTLFIPLSGDTHEDALFTTLVQEAQAKKLTLIPTLCPLQPAPNDTALERDLSLTGRSATEMNAGRSLGLLTEAMPPLASFFRRITERDFITPEAAPLNTFARRVASLSAVPGVTDIVLAEVVAPGYGEGSNADFDFIWTGGATPAARLAMLRRNGFDPMDIGNGIMGRITPPLFEGQEPDALLRKFRGERRDVYLKRLDTALKATGLRARLWVTPLLNEGNLASREQHISLWQGKLPTNKPTPSAIRLHDYAAAAMESMQQQMDGLPGDEEPNLTRRWLGNLFEQEKTQSFVLDFSDLSLADALKLVEASIAKKAL